MFFSSCRRSGFPSWAILIVKSMNISAPEGCVSDSAGQGRDPQVDPHGCHDCGCWSDSVRVRSVPLGEWQQRGWEVKGTFPF